MAIGRLHAHLGLRICLLLLLCATVKAQTCPQPFIIVQDSQLDALSSCTDYPGDLIIGSSDCFITCDVTTLAPLSNLQIIQGSLTISCCPGLTSISGLNNLQSVESIDLYFNENLQTITGPPNVITTGRIRISQHPRLRTISGFSSLQILSYYLELDRNPALTDISGFRSINMIQGQDLASGQGLSILYNTALQDLSGLASLNNIAYGTVRIEGNNALCFAGYPQWGEGEYLNRTGSATEDKGLDWRPFLTAQNEWQYTWNVPGGGIPTLVIRDNAPAGSCGAAGACHSTCMTNSGCLGPNDANTCGQCSLPGGGGDICTIPTAPPPAPAADNTIAIVLGVVLSIVGIVALVLVALGIWGCVVVARRYKDLRQGSFDISVSSVEDGVQLKRSSRASQQIATIAEPTTGSNVTRKGVKYTPKLDSVVVVSSYRQNVDTTDGAAPPRDSYTGQRSSRVEQPSTVKTRTTSRTSMGSRPKSDSAILVNQVSNASLLEGSAREPSTEDILQRLREEHAEVPMNFPWDNIKFGKELGVGDFGKVFHAEARKLLPGQKKTTIMVKQLKEGASKEERETFLRPVEAMKVLQHPNVLSLLGVSMKGPSICVMLEYCAQGNFKTFLVRKRRESSVLKQSNQLVGMASDMAAGLDYLHTMNIAHNDFAARSCLVTSESKVKLGDYGITRQTFKEDYYSRKPNQKALPIRWMAPELIVVQGRNVLDSLPVSMPGNIWSFGIALWEVCSFAQWPYDDLSNEEVLQTIKTTGKCILENPLQPSDHIAPLFDICTSCWQPADLRPTMSDIHNQLKQLQKIPPPDRKSSTSSFSPRKTSQPRRTSQEEAPPISRPKSQSLQPAPREVPIDNTARRATVAQPRRSAPTRPAPGRPHSNTATFPRTRGKEDSQKEPLIISNLTSFQEEPKVGAEKVKESRKKTASTEALLAKPPYERAAKKSPHSKTTKPTSQHDGAKTKRPKTKASELSEKRPKQTSEKPAMQPDKNKSELPLPHEMDQALHEEQALAEGGDDFILEPPQKFSQSSLDDLQGDEPRGAVGGVALHFEDVSDNEEKTTWPPREFKDEGRRLSSIERRIQERKAGHNKLLKRTETPASISVDQDDLAIPNPTWESDDDEPFGVDEKQLDEDGFDDFGEREAMEEDELPNVVYDEDVAALIW